MSLLFAQDYIYQAYRCCGQMRAGYMPSPEMLDDGLNQWFLFFDGLNARRTSNFTMPDYVFPILGPGHGTTGNGQTFSGSGYQIGPTSQDFVVQARPPAIVRANLYYTASNAGQPTRLPLSPLSMEEWMNIAVIQLTPINVATIFAYDPQWPNGVIWVWPPLNGNSLELFTWGTLIPPATLTTAYNAPPGYGDLVVYNLAMRLLPYCTKQLYEERRSEQWIRGQAELARQRIAAVNAPSPRLRNDFRGGCGGSGNADWQLLLTGIPY